MKKSLLEQKQRVLDNGCFDHINEIMNDMDAYSVCCSVLGLTK